jgi:hypothetical protein
MRVLTYQDLNLRRVRPAFDKFRKAIESGDFRSAQIRKLSAGSGPAPYWRAKPCARRSATPMPTRCSRNSAASSAAPSPGR